MRASVQSRPKYQICVPFVARAINFITINSSITLQIIRSKYIYVCVYAIINEWLLCRVFFLIIKCVSYLATIQPMKHARKSQFLRRHRM